MLQFVSGATAMAFFGAAIYFLRFWQEQRDRLFLLFSIAFGLMSLNRVMLSSTAANEETVPYLYMLRLGAFALIAFAIIDKNRARSPRR